MSLPEHMDIHTTQCAEETKDRSNRWTFLENFLMRNQLDQNKDIELEVILKLKIED